MFPKSGMGGGGEVVGKVICTARLCEASTSQMSFLRIKTLDECDWDDSSLNSCELANDCSDEI